MSDRQTPGSSHGERSARGRWLLRLFPATWRQAYGCEFLAMIDERPPGLRDTIDILISAVDARVRPAAWVPSVRREEARERGLALQSAGGPSPAPTPGTTIRVGGASAEPRRPAAQRRFSRRTFLRNALMGSVAVAAAGAGAGIYAYSSPEQRDGFGTRFVVPKDEIPAVGADPVVNEDGRFWLINNEDGVLALYWRCTHLGCTVPWSGGANPNRVFQCPCHGSTFTRYGERTAGPAPRPLDLMNTWVTTDGDLVVDTGNILVRDTYEPAQAVRV